MVLIDAVCGGKPGIDNEQGRYTSMKSELTKELEFWNYPLILERIRDLVSREQFHTQTLVLSLCRRYRLRATLGKFGDVCRVDDIVKRNRLYLADVMYHDERHRSPMN